MSALLLLSAVLLLSGPVRPADVTAAPSAQASGACPDASGSGVATFSDERLEAAVRATLSVDDSVDLTCDLVAQIDSLDADFAEIESLEGIQSLSTLRDLRLFGNEIDDVGPLAGLTRLRWLNLGRNSVRDVTPLAGLTELTFLQLRENEISDVDALSRLTRLTYLDISYNDISDIGALSGMTEVEALRVYVNPLTDISAMRTMTSLHELHIHDLPDLESVQPLVENAGVGQGDIVIVYNTNSTICSEARVLRERGVRVSGCSFFVSWWTIVLGVGVLAAAWMVVRRRNQRKWAAWRAEAAGAAKFHGPVG